MHILTPLLIRNATLTIPTALNNVFNKYFRVISIENQLSIKYKKQFFQISTRKKPGLLCKIC